MSRPHRCTCLMLPRGNVCDYCRRVEFARVLQAPDPITRPSHYTEGAIEPIDFIEAQALNFNRGNVVKYVVRAGRKSKNTEAEDLRKARWYIDRELKRLEHDE